MARLNLDQLDRYTSDVTPTSEKFKKKKSMDVAKPHSKKPNKRKKTFDWESIE